jgi:RNA polymerase subunit RPABC4/transcription elongation factor Spt4
MPADGFISAAFKNYKGNKFMTRRCPHCKVKIIEDTFVCPGCKKEIGFPIIIEQKNQETFAGLDVHCADGMGLTSEDLSQKKIQKTCVDSFPISETCFDPEKNNANSDSSSSALVAVSVSDTYFDSNKKNDASTPSSSPTLVAESVSDTYFDSDKENDASTPARACCGFCVRFCKK